MDDIDVKILKLLQDNARISSSEISSQVNLSISAVSERLKKLELSGIIDQYTTIINPMKLKKDLTALVFITLEKPKYTDGFLNFVHSQDEILECLYLAGEHDYLLKIVTKNTPTLEALLNRIKSVHGVRKTRTIVVLSTVKKMYSVIPDKDDNN